MARRHKRPVRFSVVPAVGLLALMQGCAGPLFVKTIHLTSEFDPNEVAYATQTGTATVKGSAFMRQRGGGVVTCAGEDVSAIPIGRYATERIMAIYGNTERGINTGLGFKFEPEDPRYMGSRRTTRCDAQGRFQFSLMPRGDYYLVTRVRWMVAGATEGGFLMQRVSVGAADNVEVILAP